MYNDVSVVELHGATSPGQDPTGTMRFYALANETLLLQHPSAAG